MGVNNEITNEETKEKIKKINVPPLVLVSCNFNFMKLIFLEINFHYEFWVIILYRVSVNTLEYILYDNKKKNCLYSDAKKY